MEKRVRKACVTFTSTLAAIFSLAGCTMPPSQPAASPELTEKAKSLNFKGNMSRVFIMNGPLRSPLWGDIGEGSVLDYFIGGQYVGTLHQHEFFAIDIPPGTYALACRESHAFPRKDCTPNAVTIAPNTLIAVRTVYVQHVLSGLSHSLNERIFETVPDPLKLVAGRKHVLNKPLQIKPPISSPPPGLDAESRLKNLKDLLDKGLITNDEYERKRTELVNGL